MLGHVAGVVRHMADPDQGTAFLFQIPGGMARLAWPVVVAGFFQLSQRQPRQGALAQQDRLPLRLLRPAACRTSSRPRLK